MRKIRNIAYLLVAMAVASCDKSDDVTPSTTDQTQVITFSAAATELSVTTKAVVDQGVTDFGRYEVIASDRVADGVATRVSGGSFASGDEIGVYMYYNYWFASGSESVIFNDEKLVVGANDVVTLSDGRYRLWTFSSIGGDAPFHLHALGYYPYDADVELSESTSEVEATLSWEYYGDTDLLLAYTQVAYWQDGFGENYAETQGVRFKTYLLDVLGGKVDLTFNYKLATFSLYPYKASDDTRSITINSISLNYTAPTHLSYLTNSDEETWSGEQSGDISINVTTPSALTTSATELILDDGIILPPSSVINRIAFDLTVEGVVETYYWHPHIADITAMSYQIIFELDPDRDN